MEVQSGFWVTLAERNPSRRSMAQLSGKLHGPQNHTPAIFWHESRLFNFILLGSIMRSGKGARRSSAVSKGRKLAPRIPKPLAWLASWSITSCFQEPSSSWNQLFKKAKHLVEAWGPGEGRWGTWLQELQMLRIFAPVAQAWYKPDRWWSLCCIQSLSAMLATRLYHSLSGWFACFRHDFAFLGRWFAADLNRQKK